MCCQMNKRNPKDTQSITALSPLLFLFCREILANIHFARRLKLVSEVRSPDVNFTFRRLDTEVG